MNIPTFVQSMTIWNWLALIAFIFFPLSALNAFFSLRSRYLDRRGTKNKKEFEKRLRQFEVQLFKIERYKNNPTTFFVRVLKDTMRLLVLFLASFFLFMWAYLFSLLPLRSHLAELLFVFIGLLILFNALIFAIKLSNLVDVVDNPDNFARKVIHFLKSGESKGLNPQEDDKFIVSLLKSEVFNSPYPAILKFHFGDIDGWRALMKNEKSN